MFTSGNLWLFPPDANSAFSDLVSVLIDLDIGAFCLQFLYALETALMDDWGVMVSRSMDFERVAHHSLGGWEIFSLCFPVDGGAGIFLVGENIFDCFHRPLALAGRGLNFQRFQFLLDFQEAPTLLIPFAYLQEA